MSGQQIITWGSKLQSHLQILAHLESFQDNLSALGLASGTGCYMIVQSSLVHKVLANWYLKGRCDFCVKGGWMSWCDHIQCICFDKRVIQDKPSGLLYTLEIKLHKLTVNKVKWKYDNLKATSVHANYQLVAWWTSSEHNTSAQQWKEWCICKTDC